MKNGTVYAQRLKKAFNAHRQSVGKPEIPDSEDPVRRLAIAILGIDCSIDEARAKLDRIKTEMVDWNEVRVSTSWEVCKAMGEESPAAQERCGQLIRALRSIYQKEHQVSLERLKTLGRREARQYLEQLDGVDSHAVSAVVLWGLGGHAIPVNDKLLAALRAADLVGADSDRDEVQAFLERNVSAAQAKEFCLVMESFKPGKTTASAARGKSTSGAAKAPRKSKKASA